MIKVYVHTPLIPGWESIMENLLLRMAKSELLTEADKIIFCVNGSIENNQGLIDNLPSLNSNIEVKQVYGHYDKWEYPTLDFLKKDIDQTDDNFYVCYLHLKGLSRRNLRDQKIVDWRNYLEYWTIDRWRDSVAALNNGFDTCGVNWIDTPWKHHSGNFWWANSRYIKTLGYLQDPKTIEPNTVSHLLNNIILDPGNFRFEHEAWIGSGNLVPYEIHYSPGKMNPEFHYKNEYPESEYKHEL